MRSSLSALFGFCVLLLAPGTRGEDAHVAKNRPPQINGSMPRSYFQLDPVEVRWGKELRFQLGVHDPDGDVTTLRMEAGKDVEGATFDPNERVFRWTPTQEQKGPHELRFVVSDGTLSETRVARILVVDNRAPSFYRNPHEQTHSNSGIELNIDLSANDKDDDKLTYRVANLPDGARLEERVIRWRPRESQVGIHTLQVSVSDGELRAWA